MMNLSYNDMVTKALAIIKRLVATEPWGCIYLLGWACLDYPLVHASIAFLILRCSTEWECKWLSQISSLGRGLAIWCSHRHGRGSIPDFLVD